MKSLITAIFMLLFAAPSFAQSACGQLGVDCRHPSVTPRPSSPTPPRTQTNGDSDSSGVSHKEFKNFYKAVDLGNKALKVRYTKPAEALHYLDEALALRRVSGEVRKQDQWAWYECQRGHVLLLLSRYDEALSSFAQCAGEDISDKNREEYDQWVKWGETAVDAGRHPWSPLAVEVTGDVTITSMDGREWHGDFEHANLKGATVKTGAKSKFRMALPDQTIWTVGENGEVQIDDFVYDPETNVPKFVCTMAKGTFRFLTGKIAQHGNALHETEWHLILPIPVGTIGVRGTDFTVSVPNDESMDIFLWEGEIVYSPYNYPNSPMIDMKPDTMIRQFNDGRPALYTGER